MTVFHVAIGYKGAAKPQTEIQATFTANTGWARYAPNCWIVNTTATATEVSEAIHKVISAYDQVFVVEVNLNNRNGYLDKEIWTWIGNQHS